MYLIMLDAESVQQRAIMNGGIEYDDPVLESNITFVIIL
jgi:hypothetical protein